MRKVLTFPLIAAWYVLALLATLMVGAVLIDVLFSTDVGLLVFAIWILVPARALGLEISLDPPFVLVIVGTILAVCATALRGLANRTASTPLLKAVQAGDVGAVSAALKVAGTDVNETSWNRKTGLYIAVEQGQLEIAKLLLRAGADPTVATNDGFTPLLTAPEHGVELVALLMEHGAKPWDALLIGICRGKDKDALAILRLFLDAGLSPNAKGPLFLDGQPMQNVTPLIAAVADDWRAGAQLLLERGANPATSTSVGTALELAKRRGSKNCEALLAGLP